MVYQAPPKVFARIPYDPSFEAEASLNRVFLVCLEEASAA